MAQFDVYVNPSRASKQAFPFIVDIQHEHISDLRTRMVVPLGRLSYFRDGDLGKLTPTVEYEGEKLIILVPQIASIPIAQLKQPIGTLAHFRGEILAALDFAISGV